MVQTDEERKLKQKERDQNPERRAKKKAQQKLRSQTPEYKAKEKERKASPEYKAKEKERKASPEYKVNLKLRTQSPEYKAKRKEYDQSPARKAYDKARDQTPERKEAARIRGIIRRATPEYKALIQTPEYKAAQKILRAKPEYKAKRKLLRDKPENKLKRKLRDQTPEYKANRKEYEDRRYGTERKAYHRKLNESLKFEVHSFYSKLHSNSDVPCCRCCGENFVLDFLSIDHIDGRRHLPKNEAKLSADALVMFLKRNNFPEGYQILCFNCNISKGYSKNNNECPMKNKPH